VDALCSLLMISSVLEFFGCKQQKAMFKEGKRQESRRFSFGKDTGLFTIATKKSNWGGEAAVWLQGSGQGETQALIRVPQWEGIGSALLKNQSLTGPCLDLMPASWLGEPPAP